MITGFSTGICGLVSAIISGLTANSGLVPSDGVSLVALHRIGYPSDRRHVSVLMPLAPPHRTLCSASLEFIC